MEQIILREKFKIPPLPETPGDDGNGVHSFIYRGEQLNEIQSRWGRKDCCIKVIKNNEPFHPKIEDQWWGFSHPLKGSKLREAMHIQNIYAHYGLAPRVYAVFILKINRKRYWAMLVQDMGHLVEVAGMQNKLMTGPMKGIADKYHITMFDDGRECNVVNGKYVDFQGFHLPDNYQEELKQRIVGVANVGKWGPWMNYHDIPELEIKGGRNNELRVKQMKLQQIDFRGKTVLDIGCSEGYFCHYAEKRGAKRVLGIDLPGVTVNLWELASYLGYYNNEYIGWDLLDEDITVDEPFDVVFFFSMCQHVGLPKWIRKATKELLVFEGNGKDEDQPTEDKIKEQFNNIVKVGETTDLFNRRIIWARV